MYLHFSYNNVELNFVSTKLIGHKQVNRELFVLSHG